LRGAPILGLRPPICSELTSHRLARALDGPTVGPYGIAPPDERGTHLQGYLTPKKPPHPSRTVIGPYALAYCRVLAGGVS